MFQNRLPWYLGASLYWFATSLKWFFILILLPGKVNELVAVGERNTYWGLVVAIGAVEACIGPALMGAWSDRVQKRLVFVLVGAVLTAVAAIMLASATSLIVLTAGYLLLQIADDVATGPYSALIPQLVPSALRPRAAGVMAGYQAGANLVGAVLVASFGQQIWPFMLLLAAVHLVCLLGVFRTIRHDPPATARATDKPENPWWNIWRNINFRWVWLTRFLVATGSSVLVTYGVNFLNDRVTSYRFAGLNLGGPTAAAGFLIVAMALTSIAGALLGTRMAETMDRRIVVRIAALLMCCCMLPFGFFGDYASVVWIALAYGVGNGMYSSTDWAIAADVLPDPADFGKDMGIWQSSIAVPQLFGGGIGLLIDTVNRVQTGSGYMVAFMLSAALFLLSAVLITRVRLPGDKENPRPA